MDLTSVATSFHGIADVLEHLSDSGLSILELVFDGLIIKIGKIGDRPDCCQDSVHRGRGLIVVGRK